MNNGVHKRILGTNNLLWWYDKFRKKYNAIDDGKASSRVLDLIEQLIPKRRVDVYYE